MFLNRFPPQPAISLLFYPPLAAEPNRNPLLNWLKPNGLTTCRDADLLSREPCRVKAFVRTSDKRGLPPLVVWMYRFSHDRVTRLPAHRSSE
jgi:hypothetical protein